MNGWLTLTDLKIGYSPHGPIQPGRPHPRHKLGSLIPGTDWVVLYLPLCWEAEAKQRHGTGYDPEDWYTAWDQGAIDPTQLVFGVRNDDINCPDCLEWMHA